MRHDPASRYVRVRLGFTTGVVFRIDFVKDGRLSLRHAETLAQAAQKGNTHPSTRQTAAAIPIAL